MKRYLRNTDSGPDAIRYLHRLFERVIHSYAGTGFAKLDEVKELTYDWYAHNKTQGDIIGEWVPNLSIDQVYRYVEDHYDELERNL